MISPSYPDVASRFGGHWETDRMSSLWPSFYKTRNPSRMTDLTQDIMTSLITESPHFLWIPVIIEVKVTRSSWNTVKSSRGWGNFWSFLSTNSNFPTNKRNQAKDKGICLYQLIDHHNYIYGLINAYAYFSQVKLRKYGPTKVTDSTASQRNDWLCRIHKTGINCCHSHKINVGFPQLTRSSDQFGFGCCTWWMLTSVTESE